MAKKNVLGRCPLCLEEKRLVRSHIIPKFNWKPLKKSSPHYVILSNKPENPERKSTNEHTEHLLCENCDNSVIQRYEDYLARALYGGIKLNFEDTQRTTRVSNLDYNLTKKALLSIIWRMSASKQSLFKEVDLGPLHTERIRKLLFNDEDVSEEEYPINLTVPFFEGHHQGDWTLPPDYVRTKGNRVYRCLISGLIFTFHVGSAALDDIFKTVNIKKDGSWLIVKAEVVDLPFLKHWCFEIAKNVAKKKT